MQEAQEVEGVEVEVVEAVVEVVEVEVVEAVVEVQVEERKQWWHGRGGGALACTASTIPSSRARPEAIS